MPGFRLFRVLLRVALTAGFRTYILAGCRLQQQHGQCKTANYQMSLPLN